MFIGAEQAFLFADYNAVSVFNRPSIEKFLDVLLSPIFLSVVCLLRVGNQQHRLRDDMFRRYECHSCPRHGIHYETNGTKSRDDIRVLPSHGNFNFLVTLEAVSRTKSNILSHVWTLGPVRRYVAGTSER